MMQDGGISTCHPQYDVKDVYYLILDDSSLLWRRIGLGKGVL